MYYSFLAAFTWMTVNAWDIHLVFGYNDDDRSRSAFVILMICSCGKPVAKKRRFAYPLAGWGIPLIFNIAALAMEIWGGQWPRWQPHMGRNACWFHDQTVELIYFYGPIGNFPTLHYSRLSNECYATHKECDIFK